MSLVGLRVCVVLLTGLALPCAAAAQPGRAAVASGNRLYEEGRFDEAHEQYLEALREVPDSAIAPFNDGNALYRTEEFQRAMEAYQQAAESGNPTVEAQAWYNLGNALYSQQQLEPALDAYKEALRRNPSDADAKHNLEVTLEQLQQQEQEQQQNQDDNQEQDENQDENQDQESQPQEEEGDGQENEEQDQPGEQDRPEEASPPEDGDPPPDPPDQGEQPQPQPGELSREEAERLLQAINEDPGEIQRQRRSTAPVRPPRRPW